MTRNLHLLLVLLFAIQGLTLAAPARAQEPTPVPGTPVPATMAATDVVSVTAALPPTGTVPLTGSASLAESASLTESAALTESATLTESVPLTPSATGASPVQPADVLTPTITPLVTPALEAAPALTATLASTLTFDAGADLLLDQQVELLLARMSAADRVGQLFVVTFVGSDTSFASSIAELIYGYRIGGVVLSPANSNFSNEPGTQTAEQVAILANKLQAIAYGILLPTDVALQPVPNQPWPPGNLVSLERELGLVPPNLPLLIGIEQMGDNLPNTALRRGFTPLPSPLAIGSTWNPALAQAVGGIAGRELRAVGINLLLGPSLDVVDQPRSDVVGSLGIFSFGGNPDWVGRIGRAYIAGVHAGSRSRVATAAGHFPGQGDVDRLPEEEIATIQRSLDDLNRVALPPFVAVTQSGVGSDADPAVSDILLSSQMRFNALQGSAARNTPLSLDPELNRLIEEKLGDWRDAGGLLMTGPLGVPAIRRFYDPTLQEFPARRVAMDAFTAGHDLLFLSRFALDENWENQLNNYERTIAFFQERYRSDPDFAAQVDASVRRILRLKLRLYLGADLASIPAWTGAGPVVPLSQVLVQEADLAVLPGGGAEADPVPAQAAREALTILYPDSAAASLPPAPQLGEKIVIFTDSRLQRECSTCTAEAAVDPDALARTIINLYGPEATGQVAETDITSLTFSDLAQLLPAETQDGGTPAPGATPSTIVLPTPTPTPITEPAEPGEGPGEPSGGESDAQIESTIADADWLIFAMLDVNSQQPSSDALRRFLRQFNDQLGNKRIVVLGLNAPYFLDATEIGKLSLYYGVYSKTAPYLETAARAIYRSFTPDGAPAVNAPGTRFASLTARLVPDPARALPLRLSASAPAVTDTVGAGTLLASNEPAAAAAANGGAEPGGLAVVNVGETLRIEVGPVLDLNGNPVPDGVPVLLEANFEGAELALTIEPALTRAGMAQRDVTLERGGVLRVMARAGDADSGDPVIINVLEPLPTPTAEPPAVVTVTLPAQVTVPPPITATVAATGTTPGGMLTLTGAGVERSGRVNGVTLLLSLLMMLVALSLLLLAQIRVLPRETLLKSLIWAVIAGMAGYLLYAFGWLPFSVQIADALNVFGAPLVVFLAMLLPLFWLQLRAGGGQGG